MNGKIAAGAIVISAVVAGVLLYWTQVYAYYTPVAFQKGQEITLVPLIGGKPEPIPVEGITGIDADSSPLRFRACFTTPLSQALLTETYTLVEKPEPRVAPSWFDCFDAQAIGAAMESGEAMGFLSVPDIHPGFDRVVAVYPDGRAFAWHQPNASLEK
ncbi:MAG: DUF6446 family protein [Paracoccaceae bacterium]